MAAEGEQDEALLAQQLQHFLADPQDVMACSFSNWYPQFAKVTIPSRIIELPPSFVEYLQDDGPLVLPDGVNPTTAKFHNENSDDSDSEQWTSLPEDNDAHDAAASRDTRPLPSFPELEAKIEKAISQLGGEVFPKLNWSAPRDVPWIMTCGTLRCGTPGDVFLLLKSSDFVTHDLTAPFECCAVRDNTADITASSGSAGATASAITPNSAPQVKYELVLRRWTDIATAMEFRCFVRQGRLVGVSQRDHTNFYPAVARDAAGIKRDVVEFYNQKVRGRFPRESYAFDVYRKGEGSVLLIDFNPLCPVTDELLFGWDELLPLPPPAVDLTPTSDAGADERSSDDVIAFVKAALSDAQGTEGSASDARAAVEEDPAAVGEGAVAKEETAEEVVAVAKPTLTDKLNQRLLMSFLERINDPSSGIPTYEEPEETWPDEEDDALAAERDAKVFEFLTAKMQSVQGASVCDEGGAAAAAAAVVVTGAQRGGRAAGPAAAEMANLDDVDFRYVTSAEEAKMRPGVFINSRVPKDVVQISNAQDIQELATLYRRGQLGQDDGSDSD